jgi:hypothetical protein
MQQPPPELVPRIIVRPTPGLKSILKRENRVLDILPVSISISTPASRSVLPKYVRRGAVCTLATDAVEDDKHINKVIQIQGTILDTTFVSRYMSVDQIVEITRKMEVISVEYPEYLSLLNKILRNLHYMTGEMCEIKRKMIERTELYNLHWDYPEIFRIFARYLEHPSRTFFEYFIRR